MKQPFPDSKSDGLPTLSVLIPNYNHAQYLPDCLESILEQSVQPQEIIIIDDASKDNSVAVIEEFARKHPSIKFYKNEQNRGVVFTMNRALELARTEYIYFAAADDVLCPGMFEKSLNFLAEHPEVGLCFSDPASFDHATGKINKNRLMLSAAQTAFTPEELAEVSKRKRVLISGMSTLKRSAVLDAGCFLPELKWHCDFFLLFVTAFRHGACYIPDQLNLWRATPGSYMTSGLNWRQWRIQSEVVHHILDLLNSPPYQDVARHFKKSGVLALVPRSTYTILGNRKYWSFLSFTLLKRAVPMDIFWALPHWLQRIIRRLRSNLN